MPKRQLPIQADLIINRLRMEAIIERQRKVLISILVRWRDIEALDDGGRFTSSARDQSDGLFAYCQQRLASFKDLAAAKLTAMYFQVPAETDTSLDRRLDRSVASGEEELASMSIHTN